VLPTNMRRMLDIMNLLTLSDLIGGLVTVTADRPVNRADLAAAINQAGYTVLAV